MTIKTSDIVKALTLIICIPIIIHGQSVAKVKDNIRCYDYTKNMSNTIELDRMRTIGEALNDKNSFHYITGLAEDEAGYIYVTDKSKTIKKYDAKGDYVSSFGREGEGPGELKAVKRLLIKNGCIYIYDNKLFRLTKYKLNGKYVGSFKINYNANDFAVKKNGGIVFLIENAPGSKLFMVYDKNGNYLESFGKKEYTNSEIEDHYINNGRITMDNNDNLYFSRTQPYIIEKYDNAGKLVMVIKKEVDFAISKPKITGTRKDGNYFVVTINGKSDNPPSIIGRDIVVNNNKIYNLAAQKVDNYYGGHYVIDVFSLNGEYLY